MKFTKTNHGITTIGSSFTAIAISAAALVGVGITAEGIQESYAMDLNENVQQMILAKPEKISDIPMPPNREIDYNQPYNAAQAYIDEQNRLAEEARIAEEQRIAAEQAAIAAQQRQYTPSSTNVGTANSFKSDGVWNDGAYRYTWYSSNVLHHYRTSEWTPDANGVYRDSDGYAVVASSDHSQGTVISNTPFGAAKVYDTGCASGTLDVYTNF